MMSLKVLHSADWHFRERLHSELEKCLNFIVDYAMKNGPDLIVVSGDITHSKSLSLDSNSTRTILSLFNRMLDIAPVAVVTGTDSHEGKSPLALRACKGRFPMLVSCLPEQFGYVKYSSGLGDWYPMEQIRQDGFKPQFIMTQIPQPTKQYFINDLAIEDTDKAISTAMDSIFASFGILTAGLEAVPHIVNGHGQIGGAFISETQQLIGRDIEISKAQLGMLNADLVCYGHIHKAQDMGDRIFYAGSPTRTNHGETEDKGFYFHEIPISHNTFVTNFIETPAKKMLEIKEDFTRRDSDYTEISIGIVLDKYSQKELNGSDLKINLTMWQDDAKIINQSYIKNKFFEAGCENVKFLLVRKPRETVRAVKVLEADSLADKIVAMAEMRGESVSDSILEKARTLEVG